MTDWLKLTAEDIERALEQTRAAAPTPAVMRIHEEELRPEQTAPPYQAPVMRVTEADLAPVLAQPSGPPNLTELETLMFGLVNSARQAHLPGWLGNRGLRWHEELAAVARGHSADMRKRQYVEHTTPEGVKVGQRIDRQGIRYMACGENIGVVYGPASNSEQGVYEIHKAFMNQPRRLTNHRGNLLNPVWSHVGIGVVYDESGVLYVTQNFIATVGNG